MGIRRFLTFIAASCLCIAALAADGNDWRRASPESRLAEVSRILGNIRSKGCTVKRTPEYYVRQLNDFYARAATRDMQVHAALALIATGVGEDWSC